MRRIRFMPILLSSFAVTCALLAPAASRAGAPMEAIQADTAGHQGE